jgi:hypothetical protein
MDYLGNSCQIISQKSIQIVPKAHGLLYLMSLDMRIFFRESTGGNNDSAASSLYGPKERAAVSDCIETAALICRQQPPWAFKHPSIRGGYPADHPICSSEYASESHEDV